MVPEKELEQFRFGLMSSLWYHPDSGLFTWRDSGDVAGYYDPKGYVQIRYMGTLYQAHQLAFLIMEGRRVDLVDHKNRCKHDNRWSNLREATKQINAINSNLPCNNRSGVKGVSWHKAGGKWTAQIKHNGTKIHLGSYSCLLDAVSARRKAEEELWRDLR